MPSIYDVAREAQVSIATVSRVFRGTAPVSAEVRERVLTVASALGYRPNRVARALAEGKTRALGLMLPTDMSNPFYGQVAQHVARCARAHGHDVAIGLPADDTTEGFVEAAMSLEERQVDGLLLCATRARVDAHAARRTPGACPVVAVGCHPSAEVPMVAPDRESAGYDLTRHLVELGHRDIGFLCSERPILEPGVRSRAHGYARAMEAAGLPPFLWPGEGTLEGGYDAIRPLLGTHGDVTALIAVNDAAALGALRALHELGLSVPADLSIAGFDNVPQSRYSVPSLTTVDMPVAEIAERAVSLLIALLGQGADQSEAARVIVRPHVVIRDSTAPPRPR